ncbi:hypothetical protein ACFQJD_14685 [Haloplanus sp. GCM10025708]|uniref:hypothetical protein n=1 Tax=Haloferacaceae TaxID=1644056 RepID=UPI00361A570D
MRLRRHLPAAPAFAGLAALRFGSSTEPLSLRPAYGGPIRAASAGTGTRVGHGERFLLELAATGVAGWGVRPADGGTAVRNGSAV